jgi:hypothetical protein
MKKLFLLATVAMLMTGSAAFATGGKGDKNKGKKTSTEKQCTKPCPKPCPTDKCDKSKC